MLFLTGAIVVSSWLIPSMKFKELFAGCTFLAMFNRITVWHYRLARVPVMPGVLSSRFTLPYISTPRLGISVIFMACKLLLLIPFFFSGVYKTARASGHYPDSISVKNMASWLVTTLAVWLFFRKQYLLTTAGIILPFCVIALAAFDNRIKCQTYRNEQ